MNISFKNIIPHPFKESLQTQSSQVWDSKDLELRGGNNYMIEAPSGKGKSTFLNILYGVRKDYDGNWSLGDLELSDASNSEWDAYRKEQLAMVFQGLELFDHLSSLENILLKNAITDYKTEAEIMNMMQALGVEQLKDQKSGIISFGQRQRVAIIRALCQPFNWLLLDEPFSHLDNENSEKALTLILSESQTKSAGIILTSLGEVNDSNFTNSLVL